ncbi:phosphoribosylformylglycinamidine synthase [Candidatus Uhrbacteria bacterium]|nr:phosphoribosylformylglycinamidine synthase [Candidatus Uhrbacteria bacterium]
MIYTIRVASIPAHDSAGRALHRTIENALGILMLTAVRVVTVYRLEMEGLGSEQAEQFALRVLVESIDQTWSLNAPLLMEGQRTVEVAYKPGVMNPAAASLMKVASDFRLTNLKAVDVSTEYTFYGQQVSRAQIDEIVARLLVNPTVSQVVKNEPTTLLIEGVRGSVTTIPLGGMSDEALMALSRDKLFLSLEEMQAVQSAFTDLNRDPTDVELETLAQTWSEHCSHKTFNAELIVDGCPKPSLMERLKGASRRHASGVLSMFHDNAGVIPFYDGQAICGKVETHNSPSATAPYGGAATGSGGVFRDIMGTGLGARVVLSTDMFCLGPWDLKSELVPPGCLHPGHILREVVRGVGDYGNRMGVPTANGSFHFHEGFRAKPSVIVGAYGIMPETCVEKGEPRVGDKIIVLGGKTGRDGIHGATFSSAAMTDRTASVNANAVQIGHAIEEKRTMEALLACRDAGLIRAVTDCGAGGFSSAIGEMGAKTGVRVWLDRAPLKYSGLHPWEIWVSESQERMVLAVAPEHVTAVLEICVSLNVEATVLGVFTDLHRLVVLYDGVVVCDLEMEFLHHGMPKRTLTAKWQPFSLAQSIVINVPRDNDNDSWCALYKRVMAHPNVCSREPIVRRYDHGVQGTNVLPPYGGCKGDAPNDAVVLRLLPGKPYGMVVSHGINPVLNQIDPYAGTLWAITEALANFVAVGGNPVKGEAAFIDNFIWPAPTEHWLGALDRAVDACVAAADAFGLPFVSGKDSLSSTYRGKDGTVIDIPPVLCISVFGRIPDVAKTMSTDFKYPSSKIILLGKLDGYDFGGSVFYDLHGQLGTSVPQVDLKLLPRIFRRLHELIVAGEILACHDVSEGGVAVTLAEMCFGGNIGADIDLTRLGHGPIARTVFFSENPGCFLVEVPPGVDLEKLLGDLPWFMIGQTMVEQVIIGRTGPYSGFKITLEDLRAAWKNPMREVFP